MVERADSASVAEASRVRDRSTVIKEQPNRAQREAADARQEVGRLHAINQVGLVSFSPQIMEIRSVGVYLNITAGFALRCEAKRNSSATYRIV